MDFPQLKLDGIGIGLHIWNVFDYFVFYLVSNLFITYSRFEPRHKKWLRNNHSDVSVHAYIRHYSTY